MLELIQNHCLAEKLPPLTILVVNQTGIPGPGFVAWDVDDMQTGVDMVYQYNWQLEANPFAYAADGTSHDDVINRLLSDPNGAADIYAVVKVRGPAQALFREALMKAYKSTCAFSGLTFQEALEAVHIIPWSECTPAQRMDVRNGILMSRNHHSLFDHGLITIDENYHIHYSDPNMQTRKYSLFDKLSTVDIHNDKIRLPANKSLWPMQEYIRRHNEVLGFANSVGKEG